MNPLSERIDVLTKSQQLQPAIDATAQAMVAHGEQKRDFLYVKDAVEMTIHLAFKTELAAGIYNIGSGEANTWNDLATAVFEALGQAPVIEYVDMPESIRGKYQYFTQADIGKLRATAYAHPITPLKEAVCDYVKNYLTENRRLGEE